MAIPVERRLKILNYVEEKGLVTIYELSQALGVSEMTIRRDLKMIEKDGVIKGTYDSVISVFSTGLEPMPKTR